MALAMRENEVERIKEWFDHICDTTPKYLEQKDYELGKIIYELSGLSVPKWLEEKCMKGTIHAMA